MREWAARRNGRATRKPFPTLNSKSLDRPLTIPRSNRRVCFSVLEASDLPKRGPIVQVGLGALHGGELVLDLPQPGETGLAVPFRKRALGGPKLAM